MQQTQHASVAGWFFRPRRFPGPIASALIGLAVVAIVVTRVVPFLEHQPRFLDDPAVRNLIRLSAWFLILISLWAWFSFFSVYRLADRWSVMMIPLAAVPFILAAVLGLGSTRVIEFSGSMMPR